MFRVKILAASAVIFASSFATAADYQEVKAAEEQVSDYRALRRACAITQGDQRRECFSQLEAATEDYRRAKHVLAVEKMNRQQLIGQAQ